MGLAQKLKSIKESFGKASRRAALTLGLVGGAVFLPGAAPTSQQLPSNENNIVNIMTQPTLKVTSSTELSQEDRDKINAALIQEAQDSYTKLLPYARDDYSRYLQSLEDRLNAILLKEHPDANVSVVVMNPMQMDVGLALGMNPFVVSIQLLQQQGITPDFQTVFGLTDALTGAGYVSAADDTTYTQVPLTLPGSPDVTGHTYNIVVPISEFAPLFTLDNMSRADFIDMVDRHEGWHSIDLKNIFPMDAYNNLGQLDQLALATMQQQIANQDYLRFVSWGTNSEAYADLGSCGDMIRNGKDPKVIDDIITFRLANNQDVQHMSPPVLWELKNRINDMGLENFRAMSETETHKFYNDIIDSAGLNPARLTLAYQYLMTSPDARIDFIEQNKDNPDFNVAFNYINCFMFWGENPGSEMLAHYQAKHTPPSAELLQVIDNVQNWNPTCDLTDRAFAIDGQITPISLVKAYCQLVDQIDDGLSSKDTYAQIEAQCRMVKLKNTFQEMVTSLDYVAVNADYGVDLLKVKPELNEHLAKEKGDAFKLFEVKTSPRKFDF